MKVKVGRGSECKTESESNSALVRSINFQTKVSNGGDDDANFALIVSMESREFMVQIVLSGQASTVEAKMDFLKEC